MQDRGRPPWNRSCTSGGPARREHARWNGTRSSSERGRTGWRRRSRWRRPDGRSALEAAETVGGGGALGRADAARLLHDVCSAIYPLTVGSPFLPSLPLERHGLRWIHPPIPLAHPFDDGTAAVLARGFAETGESFGEARTPAPGSACSARSRTRWTELAPELLGPARAAPATRSAWPASACVGLRSRGGLWRGAGSAASAPGRCSPASPATPSCPWSSIPTAAFGLMLGRHRPRRRAGRSRRGAPSASRTPWRRCSARRAARSRPAGRSTSLDELPRARAYLFDLTPAQLLKLGRHPLARELPPAARPLPLRAGGVQGRLGARRADPLEGRGLPPGRHRPPRRDARGDRGLGARPPGTGASRSGRSSWSASRACSIPRARPAGAHTGLGLLPRPQRLDGGHDGGRIEAQIERFAPGFRDVVLARHTMNTAQLEAYNPNSSAATSTAAPPPSRQLFTRPVARLDPLLDARSAGLLCSSSTPPSGGVHGMCGYHAARRGAGTRRGEQGGASMKVLVTGGTGVIGTAAVRALLAAGHRCGCSRATPSRTPPAGAATSRPGEGSVASARRGRAARPRGATPSSTSPASPRRIRRRSTFDRVNVGGTRNLIAGGGARGACAVRLRLLARGGPRLLRLSRLEARGRGARPRLPRRVADLPARQRLRPGGRGDLLPPPARALLARRAGHRRRRSAVPAALRRGSGRGAGPRGHPAGARRARCSSWPAPRSRPRTTSSTAWRGSPAGTRCASRCPRPSPRSAPRRPRCSASSCRSTTTRSTCCVEENVIPPGRGQRPDRGPRHLRRRRSTRGCGASPPASPSSSRTAGTARWCGGSSTPV